MAVSPVRREQTRGGVAAPRQRSPACAAAWPPPARTGCSETSPGLLWETHRGEREKQAREPLFNIFKNERGNASGEEKGLTVFDVEEGNQDR